MKQIVVGQDAIVGPWICRKQEGMWQPGRGVTIGLHDTELDSLVAGVLFEDWNGVNMIVHVTAIPGRQWLCREFLWFVFHYAFEQQGARRLTGLVASSNHEARRFDEHLGFKLEATLRDAHPEGDLLVYVMYKEDCRWLTRRKS